MCGGFRPDDKDIRDGRVRDPHLRAAEPISVGGLFGTGFHRAGVRAGIGFGQAETAYPLARGQFRQVFPALLLGPIGMDRMHHQRGLHAHHAAIAAVHPLDLARDQAIGDVRGRRAAVIFGQRHPQQAQCPHFAKDLAFGHLVFIGVQNPGQQPALREIAGGIADHALVVVQLVVQPERIGPIASRHPRRLAGGMAMTGRTRNGRGAGIRHGFPPDGRGRCRRRHVFPARLANPVSPR